MARLKPKIDQKTSYKKDYDSKRPPKSREKTPQPTKKLSADNEDYIKKIKDNINCLKSTLADGELIKTALQKDILDDNFPTSNLPNIKTNGVMYSIHATNLE